MEEDEVPMRLMGIHGGAWGHTGDVRTGPCAGGPGREWAKMLYNSAIDLSQLDARKNAFIRVLGYSALLSTTKFSPPKGSILALLAPIWAKGKVKDHHDKEKEHGRMVDRAWK